MASFYFDTSALIKLYIEEEGSAEVVSVADELDGDFALIVDITLLEARSAVRRRERAGDFPPLVADRILEQLEQDVSSLYVVQPTSLAMRDAARLLDDHPLRTLDAIQLGGCLAVRHSVPPPLTFVCADSRLCDAAMAEGLATLNPLT